MDIHFVTFVTNVKFGKQNYYSSSVRKLMDSAKKFSIEHFHLYNQDLLPVSKYVKEYMEKTLDPGYGFYSWKPLIILDVMDKINPGDVVLYHDAGRKEYNFSIEKDVNILIEKVIKHHKGIGIAQSGYLHRQWCKRDCFINMNCNEERYWNLNHLSATWSIWEKNELSLKILNEWKHYCFDEKGTITTNDSLHGKISDFSDFQQHRHDQAIITNLIEKYKHEGTKPLVVKDRWEKDINNFIEEKDNHTDDELDYSLIKSPNIKLSSNNTPLILDVWYKNKLIVLATGAVDIVNIIDDSNKIIEGIKIEDPHKNIHTFQFDIPYSPSVMLNLTPYNNVFEKEDYLVKIDIEKDYYPSYANENVLTVIVNGLINSVESVRTFITYHLNLGINRIILHYREGKNIKKFYNAVRKEIESGKVLLVDWKGKIPFFHNIRNENDVVGVGLGEVAHMNHSLQISNECQYLTWLNLDQLLVIPSKKPINEYLLDLKNEYKCTELGGIRVGLLDFKKNFQGKYYDTVDVIDNISPHAQCIFFTQNISVISSHTVTSGPPLFDKIPKEKIVVNHYPFLDNNRTLPEKVIATIDNLNRKLFVET